MAFASLEGKLKWRDDRAIPRVNSHTCHTPTHAPLLSYLSIFLSGSENPSTTVRDTTPFPSAFIFSEIGKLRCHKNRDGPYTTLLSRAHLPPPIPPARPAGCDPRSWTKSSRRKSDWPHIPAETGRRSRRRAAGFNWNSGSIHWATHRLCYLELSRRGINAAVTTTSARKPSVVGRSAADNRNPGEIFPLKARARW